MHRDQHDDREPGPGDAPGHHPGHHPGKETSNSTARSAGSSRRSAEQRLLTSKAIHEAGVSISEVWLRYFSFSGMVEEYEVHAYLQALIDLPRLQRDLIAQAVNELIDELPAPRRAPSDADLDHVPDSDPDPTG